MRKELSNDLYAPGAFCAIDRWAEDTLRTDAPASDQDSAVISDAINALLGVEL